MTALTRQNFVMYAGEYVQLDIRISDTYGNPVDISAATEMTFRAGVSGGVAAIDQSLTGGDITYGDGYGTGDAMLVTLGAAETSSLTETTTYIWSASVTISSQKRYVASGEMTIKTERGT